MNSPSSSKARVLADMIRAERRTVVLVGPQGCGKTTLARAIAQRLGGRQVDAEGYQIRDRSWLHDALATRPTSVIVDGMPECSPAMLKQLITGGQMIIRMPYSTGRTRVELPHFIFCTGSADAVPADDRRFFVVDLAPTTGLRAWAREARRSFAWQLLDWADQCTEAAFRARNLRAPIPTLQLWLGNQFDRLALLLGIGK